MSWSNPARSITLASAPDVAWDAMTSPFPAESRGQYCRANAALRKRRFTNGSSVPDAWHAAAGLSVSAIASPRNHRATSPKRGPFWRRIIFLSNLEASCLTIQPHRGRGGNRGPEDHARGRSRCPSTDEGRSQRLPATRAGIAVRQSPSPWRRTECSRSPWAAACVMIPPPEGPYRTMSSVGRVVRNPVRLHPGFASGSTRVRGESPFRE